MLLFGPNRRSVLTMLAGTVVVVAIAGGIWEMYKKTVRTTLRQIVSANQAPQVSRKLLERAVNATSVAYLQLKTGKDLETQVNARGWKSAVSLYTDKGWVFSSKPVGFVCSMTEADALVAVRGTQNTSDVVDDLEYTQTNTTMPNGTVGWVSSGFIGTARSISEGIATWLKTHPNTKTIAFAGHSMGAAVACLAACMVPSLQVTSVYLMAPPKFGDSQFVKNYRSSAPGNVTIAFRSRDDPIADLPAVQMPGNYSFYSIMSPERTIQFELPLATADGVMRHHSDSFYDAPLRESWARNLSQP